jgi:hypothetical protein
MIAKVVRSTSIFGIAHQDVDPDVDRFATSASTDDRFTPLALIAARSSWN